MTVEEMKLEVDQYCESFHDCKDCKFNGDKSCTLDSTPEGIISAHRIIFGEPIEEEPIPVEPEPFNVITRPNHYCREDAKECIDEMVMLFGKEVVKHFCLCNIWKYRYRSSAKNGEEDIKKSDQYVRIYERLCSNG